MILQHWLISGTKIACHKTCNLMLRAGKLINRMEVN